jgi:hypothetical protein
MYREYLESAVATGNPATPGWPDMARLYRSLTEEQRRAFMEAVRQVVVDTMSQILGILDGSSLLAKHRDDFHLTYGDHQNELNGDLQDYFLSPETGGKELP